MDIYIQSKEKNYWIFISRRSATIMRTVFKYYTYIHTE
jgi:hypothetical protein